MRSDLKVWCFYCGHVFQRDENNNVYADCEVCGGRIWLDAPPTTKNTIISKLEDF